MTTIAIEIMLHYYCRTDDFRDGDFSAPAVKELMESFVVEDFLAPQTDGSTKYVLLERGKVYVEALKNVRFPTWVPGKWIA